MKEHPKYLLVELSDLARSVLKSYIGKNAC